MSDHTYTNCQARALALLKGEDNVFLTGAAGTGKSWLITEFLKTKNKKFYPIVASTGTAALLVGGRTFHSYFGLGIMEGGRHATVARAEKNGRLVTRIQQAQCIIIDEVSMLPGETLATAEQIARVLRDSDEPWGGLRVIAVGDFAQLPPVRRGDDDQDWAFTHQVWQRSLFTSAYLQTNVRTDEQELINILNKVRNGEIDHSLYTFFEQRKLDPDQEFEGTLLFAHRRNVDGYNKQQLAKIERKAWEFKTDYNGEAAYITRLKRDCPLPEVLTLKEGALVMLRKNDTAFPYKYVNGTLGHVHDISGHTLTLQLLNGKVIDLKKTEFSILDGHGKTRAAATNFPVTLAWASTIHKAQGASIDSLLVDLSRLWESGQAYVALSRARSIQGLHITSWEPDSIITDPLVQQFYQQIKQEWDSSL